MRMNLKKSIQGFTLLGVLLILTVVIVISLYMALQSQQSARIKRIQFTAMQMQNILEGMLSYYIVNNHQWPTKFSDMYTNDYINEEVVCSKWPVGSDNHNCSANAPGYSTALEGFTLQSGCRTGGTCSISIVLPDNTTAKMLKAAIAYSTVSGNKVVAMISAPKAETQGNRILQIGMTMDSQALGGYVLMSSGIHCGCSNNNHDTNCREGKHHYKNKSGHQVANYCGQADIPMPTCPIGPDGKQTRPQIFIAPFGWNADLERSAGGYGSGAAAFANYNLHCDNSKDNQNCDCDYDSTHGTITKDSWKIITEWNSALTLGEGRNQTGTIIFFVTCLSDDRWDGHPGSKGNGQKCDK